MRKKSAHSGTLHLHGIFKIVMCTVQEELSPAVQSQVNTSQMFQLRYFFKGSRDLLPKTKEKLNLIEVVLLNRDLREL